MNKINEIVKNKLDAGENVVVYVYTDFHVFVVKGVVHMVNGDEVKVINSSDIPRSASSKFAYTLTQKFDVISLITGGYILELPSVILDSDKSHCDIMKEAMYEKESK